MGVIWFPLAITHPHVAVRTMLHSSTVRAIKPKDLCSSGNEAGCKEVSPSMGKDFSNMYNQNKDSYVECYKKKKKPHINQYNFEKDNREEKLAKDLNRHFTKQYR